MVTWVVNGEWGSGIQKLPYSYKMFGCEVELRSEAEARRGYVIKIDFCLFVCFRQKILEHVCMLMRWYSRKRETDDTGKREGTINGVKSLVGKRGGDPGHKKSVHLWYEQGHFSHCDGWKGREYR